MSFGSSKLHRCRVGHSVPDSHEISEYNLDLLIPKQPVMVVPSASCSSYAICLKNYCPTRETKSIEEQVEFGDYEVNYLVHPISAVDKSSSRHAKMKSLIEERNPVPLLHKETRGGDTIFQTVNSSRISAGLQFFAEKSKRGLTPLGRDEPLWKDHSDTSFASKHKESSYALNITLNDRSQLSNEKKVMADRAVRFENKLRQELKLIEKRYKSGETHQNNTMIVYSPAPQHGANVPMGSTKQEINKLLESWGQSKQVSQKINFDSKMLPRLDIQPETQKGSEKKSGRKPPRDSNLQRYEEEEASLQKRRMNRKAKIQSLKNNLSMVETVPPDLVSKQETVEYEVSDGDLTSRDSLGRQLFREDLHSDRAHHEEYRLREVANLTKGKREGATGVAKQETKLGSDGIRSRSNGKKERWERSGNYEVEHLEDSDQVRISLGKFEVQSSRTQNISDRNAAEKVPSNEVMPEKMKFDRNKLETFCLKMESKLDLLKRVSRRSEWSSTFALMKGIYLADLEKEKNSQAHEIVRLLAESVYGKMSKKILDFLFDYKFVQVIEKFSKVIEKHIYLKYARRMMDALKASKEGRRRSNQALNTNAKVLLIIKGLIKKKEVTHMQTAFSKVQEKATLVALKTINMMRKLDSVAKNIRHGFTLQTFDLLYVNSKLWRMDQIFKKYRQLLALERISKFAKSRDLLGCTASDISLRDDQSTKPNPPPQPKYPLSNYINRAESAGQGISNKKSVAENLNQILNFRAKNMDPSQPKESNTLENIRNELSNNPISRIGDSHNLSENSKTSFPGHFNDGLNIADESSEYKLRSENHSKPSTHQAEERWLDSEKTELIGKKEDRLFKNKMIDDLITHPDSQTNRGKDEDFGNYEYDLIEFDTFKKKSINKEDEEEFRVQEKSYPGDARRPRGQDHFISEFSQGKFENGGGSKNKTFNEALQKVKSPLPEISPENCFEDRSDSRPQLDVSKQEIIEKMNMNLNEIEKIFKTQEFMREFKTEESGRQHASEWTPEEKSNTGTKFSRGFNYLEVAPKSQSKQKGLILEEETYLLNPVPGKTRGEQGHSTMEREGQAISYKLDQKAENPAEFENRLNSSQLSNGNKSMKSNGSAGYSKTQMSFHKFFEAHQKPERNLEKSTQPRIPFKDKVVEIRNSSLVIKLKNKKEALDEETKRKSGFREVIEEVLEESKRIKHPPKQPRKGPSKMKQISTEENPKNHSSMILTKYKDKMNRIVFGDEDGRPKSGKASGISEGGSSSGKKLPFIKIKENARKISSQLAWEMRESDLQEERWGEGEMDDNENRQQLGATNRSNRTNHSGSVVSNSSGRLNNQNTDYKARFDEEVRSKLRHNSYTKKAEAKSKYSTEH